jgi:Bacterial alpha-L-rhamnosidase.
MAWVYRRVAGIDTDATGAGFHHLTIRPDAEEGLTSVHGEYDSAYGTVMTDWSKVANGQLTLSVRVPANSTATVYLPAKGSTSVTESGKTIEASRDGEFFAVTVGSGRYRFTTR